MNKKLDKIANQTDVKAEDVAETNRLVDERNNHGAQDGGLWIKQDYAVDPRLINAGVVHGD